jgi:hypothetical protein
MLERITTRAAATITGLMLFTFSSYAMAVTCTTAALAGTLGFGSTQLIGNSFTSAGSYTDCYTFNLAPANSDVFGSTIEIDNLSFLDIDLTSISLFSGGVVSGETAGNELGSLSPAVPFSFDSLASGTYSLVLVANVYRGVGFSSVLPLPVSYVGSITATASTQPIPPSTVPEPETLALFSFGLIGIALRRRKRR